MLPTLGDKLTTPSGQPGWECKFYNHDSDGNVNLAKEITRYVLPDTDVKFTDSLPTTLTPFFSVRFEGTLKVDQSAQFEFGLAVLGQAKLWVNGELKISNWTKLKPDELFYG